MSIFFIFISCLLVLSILLSYLNKKLNFNKTQQNQNLTTTQLANSILLGILPSNSPKWGQPDGKKKRRKRGKNKRPNVKEGLLEEKQELVCLYPFTSSSSVTQRKIKQQYDELVKSHDSNGLTLAQVGHFVNCLIEARSELQHKSEIVQRKFTITKALLFKADRSSYDRIRQQICKLELEQKRLEEDTFVYNWLQQQLKLSPAYKKMLEIGACMECETKSSELEEHSDDFADISFEELLAREKKDSFWQRNGKPRSCSGRVDQTFSC